MSVSPEEPRPDHLLHLRIENGWHTWELTCTHGSDTFHTIDLEGHEPETDDCWVMSWEDLTLDEYASGEWPSEISFPCPVHCIWMGDGLAVEYAGLRAVGVVDPKPAATWAHCPDCGWEMSGVAVFSGGRCASCAGGDL